jgi:hypothetical protein
VEALLGPGFGLDRREIAATKNSPVPLCRIALNLLMRSAYRNG